MPGVRWPGEGGNLDADARAWWHGGVARRTRGSLLSGASLYIEDRGDRVRLPPRGLMREADSNTIVPEYSERNVGGRKAGAWPRAS